MALSGDNGIGEVAALTLDLSGTTTLAAYTADSDTDGANIGISKTNGSLTVGSVDGVTGVVTENGDVGLAVVTAGNDLGVNAAVTATGGDVVLDAAQHVTTGGGARVTGALVDVGAGGNVALNTAATNLEVDFSTSGTATIGESDGVTLQDSVGGALTLNVEGAGNILDGGNNDLTGFSASTINGGITFVDIDGGVNVNSVAAGGSGKTASITTQDGGGGGDLHVDYILADGTVTLRSAGAIDDDVGGTDGTADVVSGGLLDIQAGGADGDTVSLDTSVASLTAASVDDLDIDEADAITITAAGITTVSGGLVDIATTDGSITVGGDVDADTTGTIALTAAGAGSNLNVNAQLIGNDAEIALTAGNGINLAANVNAGTVASELYMDATSGSIIQTAGAITATGVRATAQYGAVVLNGSGNDLNAISVDAGGPVQLNDAGALAIGTVDGQSGIFSTNGNTIDIGVSADGALSVDQAIQANGGVIALTANADGADTAPTVQENEDLTVGAEIDGSHVYLTTAGSDADVVLAADVDNDAGDITINAADQVALNANLTANTAADSDISITAGSDIVVVANSVVTVTSDAASSITLASNVEDGGSDSSLQLIAPSGTVNLDQRRFRSPLGAGQARGTRRRCGRRQPDEHHGRRCGRRDLRGGCRFLQHHNGTLRVRPYRPGGRWGHRFQQYRSDRGHVRYQRPGPRGRVG